MVALRTPPSTRDIVVIGASAGGVEALRALVGSLPPNLPASVLVVLHMPAGGTSALASILARSGTLPAVTARNDAVLERGVVYVAPPDHHLLVDDDRIVLSVGATENGHRPAINALFRSVAVSAGPRAIGVQLSGNLDDGVAGLRAITRRGGKAVVQTPAEALYPAMPENALREVAVDHVLPAGDIGGLLGKLTAEQVDLHIAERHRRVVHETTYAAETPREHLGDLRAHESDEPSGAGPPT